MSGEVPIHTLDKLIEALVQFRTDPELHPTKVLQSASPEFPIHFYDRHLDPRLTLTRVKIVPSLHHMLSEFCGTQLELFKNVVKATQRFEVISEQRSEMRYARDFSELYGDRLAQYCLRFPSALYLHPNATQWKSVTEYATRRPSRNRLSTFVGEGHIRTEATYRSPYDTGRAEKGIYLPDEAAVRKLNAIHQHSESLALWHFYPLNMAGQKVITQMSDTTSFRWETSHTTTPYPILPHPCQNDPDAEGGLAARIRRVEGRATRRMPIQQARTSRQKVTVVSPSFARRDVNSAKPYRVDWRHFIQHGWSQAVAEDVTFIVFTCGKLERIGVRHRASKTLFLSAIIDTGTSKPPVYGKIHLGLHFAVMEDALKRCDIRAKGNLEGPPKTPTPRTSTNKRPANAAEYIEEDRSSKRQKKTTKNVAKQSQKSIFEALSARNLFLLSLNYGVYQSAAPSSFVRKAPSCAPGFHSRFENYEPPSKRKSYTDDEYVTLSLGKAIGDGATGTTHRATASIRFPSGEVEMYDLVVKLVFLDRVPRYRDEPVYDDRLEDQRLWDEYAIYQHLAGKGCTNGILPVFGIFEDIDTGTLALVMGDGGNSLQSTRFKMEGDDRVKIPLQEDEQERLLDALQSIHEAGVHHRDIWATNIVRTANGDVFIIDFDMAELGPYPSESMDREKTKLERLVKGIDDETDELLYSFD